MRHTDSTVISQDYILSQKEGKLACETTLRRVCLYFQVSTFK